MRSRTIDVEKLTIHLLEAGSPDLPAIVLLHGWPESSMAFERLMTALQSSAYVIAIDLPGIGESVTPAPGGDKLTLARYVRATIKALGLTNVMLVGHDVGGMIAYAYLHGYPGELRCAAILDVVIPGVPPWDEVLRNPWIWHFAFHAVPHLPELLVSGHEAEYFAFFYDAISATPASIDAAHRAQYVAAYARPEALRTGFEWYRAFAQDASDNQAVRTQLVNTPVLCVRGDHEPGSLDAYVDGFRANGLVNVEGLAIPHSGHFTPEEQPELLASALRRFAALGTGAR